MPTSRSEVDRAEALEKIALCDRLAAEAVDKGMRTHYRALARLWRDYYARLIRKAGSA
jgi:hypothetical protein